MYFGQSSDRDGNGIGSFGFGMPSFLMPTQPLLCCPPGYVDGGVVVKNVKFSEKTSLIMSSVCEDIREIFTLWWI